MGNKLIYWIPIVGVFVSLMHYEKENDLAPFWSYYQAIMIMATIWIFTFIYFWSYPLQDPRINLNSQ